MVPTLGQRLRALRVERGLSQADLAGDLVSPSYVSLIESGRRSPERDVLEGLARKLGCSVFYLESGVPPEELNEQRLRLQFAEIALANGALAEARDRFSELSAHARGEIRHSASWGLVRAEEAAGDLDAAITHLDGLLTAARASEPGTPGLMLLLNTRCRIYYQAGDFARSVEVGEDALREVRALGLEGSEEEIRLATTLVSSYWGRGDLFSAQHLAGQVIDRAERLGSRTAQGRAYWNACLVAEARGDLTLALDLAQRSLALLSESSLDLNLATLRVTYGWLLLRCEPPRLDEAETVLARAHEVLADRSHHLYLTSCETEMARCALLRGDLDQAVELSGQAIARSTQGGESENARVIRGLALILSGRTDQGIAEVSAAARQLAEAGSRREAAQAWRELAEALLQRDNAKEAITALRHAADCAGARPASIRSDMARQAPKPATVS
ncbi:MAG: helix-turn-helix domain-containing protein [Streptosporangiaceae bacterium]